VAAQPVCFGLLPELEVGEINLFRRPDMEAEDWRIGGWNLRTRKPIDPTRSRDFVFVDEFLGTESTREFRVPARVRRKSQKEGFLTSVAGAAWMPRSMWTGNL